jgi:hypothetical protein
MEMRTAYNAHKVHSMSRIFLINKHFFFHANPSFILDGIKSRFSHINFPLGDPILCAMSPTHIQTL